MLPKTSLLAGVALAASIWTTGVAAGADTYRLTDGDGVVHLTYSTGARGLEFLMGYYGMLDRAPRGRDETDMSEMWIRRHDEYDQ